MNAAIAQSDNSFLAQAIALSAAAGGATVDALPSLPMAIAQTKDITVSTGAGTSAALATLDPFKPGFGSFPKPSDPLLLGIKPVLELDQRSRYLQHLHELRRINEGDDTSDSPGYSLNLVRIPVSMLPGKLTRTGFGAEITVTATPFLSDDLLPTTFRNLVINDLVDQLRLPLARVAEQSPFREDRRQVQAAIPILKHAHQLFNNFWYEEADKPEIEKYVESMLQNHFIRRAPKTSLGKVIEIVDCLKESDANCTATSIEIEGGFEELFTLIESSYANEEDQDGCDNRLKIYRKLYKGLSKYPYSVIDRDELHASMAELIILISDYEVGKYCEILDEEPKACRANLFRSTTNNTDHESAGQTKRSKDQKTEERVFKELTRVVSLVLERSAEEAGDHKTRCV